MICLAVDASGPAASAAVAREGALIAERTLVLPRAHASRLAPMAQGVLADAQLSIAQVDVVACICGPGSFTGVRIGVALAQGIALAADKPCCPVDALEAYAYPYRQIELTVCPILDARAGQVYGAAFRRGQRLLENTAAPIEDFHSAVQPYGPALFIGDGAGVNVDAIAQLSGGSASIDPARTLRAADGALLALSRQTQWLHPAALRPVYLRAPQAERERLANG